MRKEKTFREKLLPLILALAAIPVVILSVMAIVSLEETLTDRYQEQVKNDLQQSVRMLDVTLDKYTSILHELSTDEEFQENVRNLGEEQGKGKAAGESIQQDFAYICRRNTGIEGMSLLGARGTSLFYEREEEASKSDSWMDESLFVETDQEITYHTDTAPVFTKSGEQYLFHIIGLIKDEEENAIGQVVMSLNESVIRETIQNGSNTTTFIIDKGRVISSSDSSAIGISTKELSDDSSYVETRTMKDTGWKIEEHYSLSLYARTLWGQVIFELMIAVAVIVILVVVAYFMSAPLVRQVGRIVTAMNAARSGDFSVRLTADKKMPYELNRISEGFNDMMRQIDILDKQGRAAAEEQRNAELQALEAQIDPHFLYNTLDAINWKAIEKGELEISQMLGDLADILRYSVMNAGEETTVRGELYWLRQYVRLQQERIGKEILIEEDVPEDIKNRKLHKLLLQPFAENSIRHGFRDQQGECRLLIRMAQEEGLLHIVIEDNGKGIGERELEKIRQKEPENGHVGIENVRKRLQLYYSSRASLEFESVPGEFTRVHMYIPTEKGGDIDENRDCRR